MAKHQDNQSVTDDAEKPEEIEVILSDEWHEFSQKFTQAESWQDNDELTEDSDIAESAQESDDFFNDFDPLEAIKANTQTPETEVGISSDAEEVQVSVRNTEMMVLSPRQTLENIKSLYQDFKKQLDKQQTIEIDASAVKQIDTATMQLLLAAQQTLAKTQQTLVINFPSEAFVEAAQLLGMEELLGLDQIGAGLF